MAKKKSDTAEIDTIETPQPSRVSVTIRREHCLLPHSIELRKDDAGLIIAARTEDWRHTYTIGAKTVADVFTEVGHEIPSNNDDLFRIVFSPFNGEVVAIEPAVDPTETDVIDDGISKTDETEAAAAD